MGCARSLLLAIDLLSSWDSDREIAKLAGVTLANEGCLGYLLLNTRIWYIATALFVQFNVAPEKGAGLILHSMHPTLGTVEKD